ncbi:Protein tyrosine/serine phosphatase [Xaviernesmea oryzae]|uniref:Protein tyrosine/serine phosphatase n=1 Tax=Xaviernesmea oryzae TaxID=464029 RepID=A0A1X7ES35_9HYPH|nr:dual specificity protein phosphatase family protein [Xaviernesmea oryzae]SMF39165.1 Protein tyrosine/serine phosphatase [Xaviernesmea oryzae]
MRKFLKRSGIAVGASLLSIGVYLGVLQLTGNFHEVLPGQLYRSAQPSPGALADYLTRYGIKTVINLRGESQRTWYKDEVAVTRRLDVQHIDFRMSAGRELTNEESERLIAILRDAPKPILIHCLAGADRTGLASVIYLQQIANVGEEMAELQLSLIYGHVGLPFLRAYAMDETWEGLEKVFGLPS